MMKEWRSIQRNKTREIKVGNVYVGGKNDIAIQTMTNTLTSDSESTLHQIHSVYNVGCDIIRVSCPHIDDISSMKYIVKHSPIPVVADIHFDYRIALACASIPVACLRINPGNIGSITRVQEIIDVARCNGCAIRIGINSGSLQKDILAKYGSPCPDALVESACRYATLFDSMNFYEYKISVKSSDPLLTYHAYKQLVQCVDCPLHIGVTESGTFLPGTVKSSIILGRLLWEGIGDTIRVSLAADPIQEVTVAKNILKSLYIYSKGASVIACPTCSRKGFDVESVSETLEKYLESRANPITISIIGCVVNGPGEALSSDIGFVGGGGDNGMMYVRGKLYRKIPHDNIVEEIIKVIDCEFSE